MDRQRNDEGGSDGSRIDGFLEELAELVDARPIKTEFRAGLISCISAHLHCVAAIIWVQDQSGSFQAAAHFGLAAAGQPETVKGSDDASGFLRGLLNCDGIQEVINSAEVDGRSAVAVLGRKLGGGSSAGECLQIFCESDALAEYRDLLQTAGMLLDDYYRQSRLDELELLPPILSEFTVLSAELQRSASREEIAFTLVNGLRRFLRSDRVSLLRSISHSFQVTHVSGVEELSSRSSQLRALVPLVDALEGSTNPILLTEIESTQDADSNAALAVAATHYRQQNHPVEVLLIPFNHSQSERLRTALVVEWYSKPPDRDTRYRVRLIESTISGTEARLHAASQTRMSRLFRPDGPFNRRRMLGVGFGLILLTLLLLPVPFRVQAEGELLPHDVRDVFSTEVGTVGGIKVTSDALVHEGEVLLRVESPELQLEFERLQGRVLATQERLRSLRASRLLNSQESPDSTSTLPRIEEAELQAELDGLIQQRSILTARIRQLDVTSPIDGLVLTWDVKRKLEERPVQPGQVLLTIANPDGSWEGHLRIPVKHLGYVTDAQSAADGPLPVELTSDAGQPIPVSAVLARISSSANQMDDGQSYVKAVVVITDGEIGDLRPGSTLRASIKCGRRALGFVWFHDVFAYLRMQTVM